MARRAEAVAESVDGSHAAFIAARRRSRPHHRGRRRHLAAGASRAGAGDARYPLATCPRAEPQHSQLEDGPCR
jgi:hypothetical protein